MMKCIDSMIVVKLYSKEGEIILKRRGAIRPIGWEDQMTSAAGIVSPKVPAMGKRPSTDVSLWPMAT